MKFSPTSLTIFISYTTAIPFTFDRIDPNETSIVITGRQYTSIDSKKLANFRSATSLCITNSSISSIPESIGKLKGLNHLHICNSPVKRFPMSLCSLKITKCTLESIKSLPSGLFDFKHLQSLELIDMDLKSLPAKIGNLSSLKKLFLTKNKLSELPFEFCLLQNLEQLDISLNDFNRIPIHLFTLKSLMYLDLSKMDLALPIVVRNDFENLKIEFLKFKSSLEALNLSKETLEYLESAVENVSKGLVNLKTLKCLNASERISKEMSLIQSDLLLKEWKENRELNQSDELQQTEEISQSESAISNSENVDSSEELKDESSSGSAYEINLDESEESCQSNKHLFNLESIQDEENMKLEKSTNVNVNDQLQEIKGVTEICQSDQITQSLKNTSNPKRSLKTKDDSKYEFRDILISDNDNIEMLDSEQTGSTQENDLRRFGKESTSDYTIRSEFIQDISKCSGNQKFKTCNSKRSIPKLIFDWISLIKRVLMRKIRSAFGFN